MHAFVDFQVTPLSTEAAGMDWNNFVAMELEGLCRRGMVVQGMQRALDGDHSGVVPTPMTVC